jgi:hypothetical protein
MGEHPPGVVMARGLPEEPAFNMNFSAQALHTVTIVFLIGTGIMTAGAAMPGWSATWVNLF